MDGVIGAFAITDQILLIATGLGIGALYVRVMTVHMLRHGVLDQYRYLEHGAHYAIGILAVLLASLKFEISEVVTGLTGMLFVVVAALIQSYVEAKADRKNENAILPTRLKEVSEDTGLQCSDKMAFENARQAGAAAVVAYHQRGIQAESLPVLFVQSLDIFLAPLSDILR